MTDAASLRKRSRVIAMLMDTFGLTPTTAIAVALFVLGIASLTLVWIVLSAPPRSITVLTGPPDSMFQRYAERYQKILQAHGVELRIVATNGSVDNLQRLQRGGTGADFGFVQGGLTEGMTPRKLESLGSVAYLPLWIFYRHPTPIARLSELAGKRIAIGKTGSGTHALAVTLLLANGITSDNATLVDDDAATAAAELQQQKLDAIFLMGEAAPIATLRTMIRAEGIRIYDFTQPEAYVRRYPYLNRIDLPQGAFDLGQNVPARDIALVGPTVDLVARKGLNTAIAELLIETAREVHQRASILQKQGEFPAPLEHEFKISEDARRYYQAGKGFLAKAVHNIWLASLINRILVAVVPALLVLIPVLRLLPIAFRLRIQLRIYRCYRPLLQIERDSSGPLTRDRVQELLARLDEIEHNVDRLKVPASFGDQFYELRQHLVFVRRRLRAAAASDAMASRPPA